MRVPVPPNYSRFNFIRTTDRFTQNQLKNLDKMVKKIREVKKLVLNAESAVTPLRSKKTTVFIIIPVFMLAKFLPRRVTAGELLHECFAYQNAELVIHDP